MAKPKVVETLRKVREKLAAPERWTKGAMSRDSAGLSCAESWKGANCWCLGGTVWKLFPIGPENEDEGSPKRELRTSVFRAIRGAIPAEFPARAAEIRRTCLPPFNDHPETTHADILRVIDRAIADAERGGGA